MSMPEMNGVEAARRIRRAVPQTEVVIFTAREDDENIREIFEAGVKSYILKSEATGHLVAAIKALSRHKPFFTDQVSAVLFRRFMSSSPRTTRESEQLSARELEIVLLLAQGKTNKETANGLGISLRTVEAHRANIMSRPGMSSLAAIVRYAVRHGIIDA
jgi:DNA-binding NarL/FixJ family response regulator